MWSVIGGKTSLVDSTSTFTIFLTLRHSYMYTDVDSMNKYAHSI